MDNYIHIYPDEIRLAVCQSTPLPQELNVLILQYVFEPKCPPAPRKPAQRSKVVDRLMKRGRKGPLF